MNQACGKSDFIINKGQAEKNDTFKFLILQHRYRYNSSEGHETNKIQNKN